MGFVRLNNLFMRFIGLNCRKINTAFAITSAAFFYKQTFIQKPANVKNRYGK